MSKHKNLVTTLILVLLLPMALLADSGDTAWDLIKVPVTQLLGLVLTMFGVPLIIRWGRKLGVDITEQAAKDAINALINILVNIDITNTEMNGEQKKQLATLKAEQTLSNAQKAVLERKYGTLEAAVQVAFERSSLNRKGAK